MRDPSASTKPSRNPAAVAAALYSDVADVRQHLLSEQFERFHQLVGMFRARGLERQIDDAAADLSASLLQLGDDLVRPAAEVDWQHTVDIGRPSPLAGDVALVEFQQRGGDPVLQREYRLPRVLRQRLPRLLAGLGDQDVGAIDDPVRLRLPAVARALVLVVAGHLAHYSPRILTPSLPIAAAYIASHVHNIKIALLGPIERAERHAEADMGCGRRNRSLHGWCRGHTSAAAAAAAAAATPIRCGNENAFPASQRSSGSFQARRISSMPSSVRSR